MPNAFYREGYFDKNEAFDTDRMKKKSCMTDQVIDLLERKTHAHEHGFARVVARADRALVVFEQLVDESVLGRCRVH